ncbi:MAG TPA: tRNA lysidine(34) synthetase TilS [Ktedonobacteraceae bacterium]
MTDTILETVATFIAQEQLFPEQGTVVVAVSGGADSLCLLHLLKQLCGPGKRYPHIRLHVAHLNHQLRGEASERDVLAVAQLAQSWHLPYTSGKCDVYALARTEQRSLEDAARQARYRFLREVAQGQPIAVAHHQDDQAETLILHWLRGGGLSSQIGLQPRQQDIIRPLLCLSRADTLAYCQRYQLTPLEDASNRDMRFLRNRIRHELLPLLEQINPGIRATLLRTAEIMEVDYAWIEEQVSAHWPHVVISASDQVISLRRNALLTLPLSLQRHLLRRVTAQLSGGQSPLELRHFKLLEQLLLHEGSGEELSMDLPGQLHMRRRREELFFEYQQASEPLPKERHEAVLLPIPGECAVPGTPWIAEARWLDEAEAERVRQALRVEDWDEVWRILHFTRYVVYIDGDSVGKMLRVRTRRPGDRMQPLGMQHEKKVQDVFVDKRISRAEREQLPLFFKEQSEQQCVWLGGVTLDQRVRLTSQTQRILCLLLKNQP